MQDIIIIIILVCLISFGTYRMWLQLSGRKTCCGGTKERIKTKKLDNIIGVKTVYIEGMHCDSCKNSVTKALNSLDGVSAKVTLPKKSAKVSFSRQIEDDEIIKIIEKRGFKVLSID